MQITTKSEHTEAETAELNRVLSSECFARSTQLRKLLLYLAANSGAGREVVESDVAREALGRRADFDPVTDAIVRKEMGRLRRRLETYYETEGSGSTIRIQIPKGGYGIRYIRTPMMPVQMGVGRRVQIAFQGIRGLGGVEVHFAELISDDLLTALVRLPFVAVAVGGSGLTPNVTLWGNITRPAPTHHAIRLRISHPVSNVILWQIERNFVEPVTGDQVESLTREVGAAVEMHCTGSVYPSLTYDLVMASLSEAGPGQSN